MQGWLRCTHCMRCTMYMSNSVSDEALLTPGEVARRCGISVSTVWRYANNGELPFVALPNGQRRYRANDVQAFISAGGAS